jgi:hypothetical protein
MWPWTKETIAFYFYSDVAKIAHHNLKNVPDFRCIIAILSVSFFASNSKALA